MTFEHTTPWLQLATSARVIKTAVKVALVVGTLLALINHGSSLLVAEVSATQWLQIGLTYLVPYCVSTYSSVTTLRNQSLELAEKPAQTPMMQQTVTNSTVESGRSGQQ